MRIIRSRRFSSVRFWHLLLLLAAIGWMSVGLAKAQGVPTSLLNANVDPCPTPVATTINFQPLFPLPVTQIMVIPSIALSNDKNVAESCEMTTEIPITDQLEVASASARLATTVVKATPKPTTAPVPKPVPTATSTPVSKPIPVSKPASAPVTAPAELESLFNQHAATHGVDPLVMKKIAQCESGMRPEATNGPYGGMFQFVASTWVSNRKAMGKDPNPQLRFNAAEAIETAAFKMGRDGYGAWPACSRKALASI